MNKLLDIIEKIKGLFINDNGINIFGKVLFSLIVIVASIVIVRISQKIFKRNLLANKFKINYNLIDEKKSKTIYSIINNAFKYIIYFIAIMIVFDIFGINTKSITTFAGVGGIIIGLGAQTLVKDIIAGFFIIFEGQYSIGDSIVINNTITGNIMEFGMKNTKIKGFDGSITTISNGNITTVKNISSGSQRALVELVVPTNIEYSEISNIVDSISNKFKDDESITQLPILQGITDIIIGDTYKIAIVAWTKPGSQYLTEVKIRDLFVQEIDELKNRELEKRGDYEI